MIDRIIHFSIRNKLLIGLLISALIGWGVYSLVHLPLDAVPDITDNQVQVITNSPTLAAQEVEQLITYPLELAMGNIPGVIEVRSVSRFGLSVITVVFRDEVDIYRARQLIGERIQEADITPGLGKPQMGPITTGLGEIYQYVLYAAPGYEERYNAIELRSIQDWVVKRQLLGIEGVIEINSSGGYLKQYEIAVEPDKLRSMNVSLPELFEAVARNNANAGGAYIEKKAYTYFIRGEGRLRNRDDIENIMVKHQDGLPIFLADLAEVRIGHAPRFGAVTMNGRGEVVAGQVMMLKGANAAEVTHKVKERMEQIKNSLPEGVGIEPYLDRSKLVARTTRTVVTNLVEGGLIVIFILVLLLGNLRAGLIVASVIPLSMLFAVAMMRVFGVSANLMSLGAIDFGLIVDGAVIVVEAILHHLGLRQSNLRWSAREMDREVGEAATRIRRSAAFGEIIILIVYLPILFLTGIEGKMFKPMAQTVSFAILGALLLSLTYVPMMSALLLSRKRTGQGGLAHRIIAFAQKAYLPALQTALRFKFVAILATLLLLFWSLWVFSRLGGEFIPTLEEGDFALHQILPPGSSLAQGVEVSHHLQDILLDKFPEVEKVVTKIGTAEIPTDIMPLEAGDIYVIMKPKSEWTTASTKEEMFAKMEEELNEFPGVIYEFTQPIQMRFNELMTGIRQDIAIKIYGEDTGLLINYAKQAERLLETLEGASDIQVEPTAGLQQIVARYDRAKMAKYGLDVSLLNDVVRMGFAGVSTGYIFEGERRFDLVIRLREENRRDIRHVRDLYVPLPDGGQIPLSEVADIQFAEGPTQISRDNTQRRITIGVNARNRDVESLVVDIRRRLETELNLPPGYYVTYGGQFENLRNARASLMVAVPGALALIFVLLFLTFQSAAQALLIFTAIPLSAIGGIWALYLRGMPFSISAGVGFIALFGVAVLNGIVLIGYFNQLKSEGMSDTVQRIMEGTKVRLRPVLMTASVASLGFLPMAFSQSAGAEVQQPLATVVIGGLLSATYLTLFILPILYYYLERGSSQNPGKTMAAGLLLLLFALPANAQEQLIGEEAAIARARAHYPGLDPARRSVLQAERLQDFRMGHPPTSVFLSGEEFNFSGISGIQSIGFSQNFNLPKVGEAQRSFYEKSAALSKGRLALTTFQLEGEVRTAYLEVVYLRQVLQELKELVGQYTEMENVAVRRLDTGEGAQAEVLSVRLKREETGRLQQEFESQYDRALINFNFYLGSDSLFVPATDDLRPAVLPSDNDQVSHPALEVASAAIELAGAEVQIQRSRLVPQVSTQMRLQSIQGQTLFWAYQVGLNIPLFSAGQRQKIEAAEVGVEVQQDKLRAMEYEIDQRRVALELQRQQVAEMIKRHDRDVLPVAEARTTLTKAAWLAGEGTYLEHLASTEDLTRNKLKGLDLLKWFHLIGIEIDHLKLY